MIDLKEAVDICMQKVPEVKDYCNRCLRTERWGGSVVLMIVDASFTSLGLNYFQAVVPKVDEFRREFLDAGKIKSIEDLSKADVESLRKVWKNRRRWEVAKAIASFLVEIKRQKGLNDRETFTYWARQSRLEDWRGDPIGRIKGVGINTFQYLRMMGGIDTVMPDKIVKKVIGEIFEKAGLNMPENDICFVKEVERIARGTGYKAVELCWMTWLIQSEGELIRIKKYADVLPKI